MKRERMELTATVSEITSDANAIVPIDKALVDQVTAGDDEKQFVVMSVKGGMSKNKRRWTTAVLRSIAEQIREKQPVGYMGHIPEKDQPYSLPDPQTIWLGATVVMENSGEATLYYKGYNLPGSKARDLVPRKAITSTSWSGEAVLAPINGGYEVKEFALESIDWSRKGKEGMESRVLAVTSEMEEGVDPKEIAALSLDELRQHNPLLVDKIEREAREESERKIGEMTEAAKTAGENVTLLSEIRKKLGIAEDASPLDAIVQLSEKVEEATKEAVKGIVDDVFKSKIKNEKARGIVQKLVTVGEMKDDETPESYKVRVESAVDEALTKDDNVKAVVSEMSEGKQEGGRRMPVQEHDRTSETNENGDKKDTEFLSYEQITR